MGLFRRSPARPPAGPLAEFAAHAPDPPQQTAATLRLLAVDIETTGLDPAKDHLLSIGFVPVDGDSIILGGAGQVLVRPEVAVGQSATFHHLTDDQLADGRSLEVALTLLLRALQGRVMLAHHAGIESGFLAAACRRTWGAAPEFVSVDTLQLQYRLLCQGFDDEPAQGALRLHAARDQFGLPRYRAHDALTDALACAELYLAQVAQLGWQTPLKKLR
ncbi:exonuclease domain-containing protein [Luteococcus sediminum]|uniref:3'-5' exonuclease n=1 Tax=Luteococcus sp. TaxID=1969402 RepID=UPI003734D7D5